MQFFAVFMLGVAGARATGSAGSARPDIWFILSE